jgi:hypothetical protein
LFQVLKTNKMSEILKKIHGEKAMSRTHVSEWCKWVSKEGMKSSLTAGLEV